MKEMSNKEMEGEMQEEAAKPIPGEMPAHGAARPGLSEAPSGEPDTEKLTVSPSEKAYIHDESDE